MIEVNFYSELKHRYTRELLKYADFDILGYTIHEVSQKIDYFAHVNYPVANEMIETKFFGHIKHTRCGLPLLKVFVPMTSDNYIQEVVTMNRHLEFDMSKTEKWYDEFDNVEIGSILYFKNPYLVSNEPK